MSMTTRAAVCRAPGQPWEITGLELDEPKANEIRIKFHAAGLCHSDDHIQKGDAPMRMPVVGGHEGAGVVDLLVHSRVRVVPVLLDGQAAPVRRGQERGHRHVP